MSQIEQLTSKSTAALVRTILRGAFPRTKFRVTTERGSMVSSVSVRWVDGPTVAAVDALVQVFTSGRFDGMTDGFDYKRGTDRLVMVGEQMYEVGCRYVHTQRTVSADLANRCIQQIAAYFGAETVPVAKPTSFGSFELEGVTPYDSVSHSEGLQWRDAIWQAACDASRFRPYSV